MIQILQLKGKDKQMYKLLAPLVMDVEVIRANNNYPFKTGDKYVWFIAVESRGKNKVLGFMPVEQKSDKRVLINNYYVAGEGTAREEVLADLINATVKAFPSEEKWQIQSVTLIQDKEAFEKFKFQPIGRSWKLYVKMSK